MAKVLERFLAPKHYVPETPERKVSIDGKLTSAEYDPTLTLHLNEYRPLWALAGMRSKLLKKKGLAPGSEGSDNHVVSFTITLWSAGLRDEGHYVHVRIVTSLKEAALERKGACGLEKAIEKLVSQYVERPVKERFPSQGGNILSNLRNAKRAIEENLSTQPGGPSRDDLQELLVAVEDGVAIMLRPEA